MPELISCKTLITYIITRIQKTTVFGALDKALRYFRRFRLVARIITYIRIALTIIETSAVLLLFAAFLVVLIPLTLVTLAIFAAVDFFIGRRILDSVAIEEMLSRERVYVISRVGRFGDDFARELAHGGAAVFVISACPTQRFICAKMQDGVYYIRHAFYFRLKRKKLCKISEKTVYLI